jgi:hypothetical protein
LHVFTRVAAIRNILSIFLHRLALETKDLQKLDFIPIDNIEFDVNSCIALYYEICTKSFGFTAIK